MREILSARRTVSPSGSTRLQEAAAAACRDADEELARLKSTPAGLSLEEARRRLLAVGPNEVASERPVRWFIQLPKAFNVPFNYLLLTLAAVSLGSGDSRAAVVIGVMVAISGLLRFAQEYRSGREAEQLKALVHTTAAVVRSGAEPVEIPVRELVPGDVVHLAAGDLVPADVRVLAAKDLFVSQAALTGESMPVEKTDLPGSEASQRLAAGATPFELPNICFMGGAVIGGSAQVVVVATGAETYLGSLAAVVLGRRPATAFDAGIWAVSTLLIRFMLILVPIVILVNGLTKGTWGEAILFGLAIAVGLTPEMLPMIVTANLARGAVSLSRRKVIVKHLPAIQNFGAMDVLCTDKTGTLTQDRVILIRHLNLDGEESEAVFEYAYLNSHFQTGLHSLLDRAVLQHASDVEVQALAARFVKRDEVPFDFVRRRMTVIVHEAQAGEDLLLCKGAVDEVLTVCTHVGGNGDEIPLTDAIREKARALVAGLNEDGLRVVAVGVKREPADPNKSYGVADEAGLKLVGFVAFLDPPKETAAPALAALARSGVAVKILTGDNERVSHRVCHDVGLPDPPTLLGSEVERMTEADLDQVVESTVLFARMTPTQKARVIVALKRRGRTVGYLGDGINDAPALRAADVGVSVDTAADVAKESADIILLEKSLLVLADGVTLGRQTYANTIKYIKMAASSNFGNVFSVLIASAWLPFLPMLAIHLLIQNLLYDISQVGIPFDRVDEEDLDRPRPWRADDLGRFMLCLGPVSSIFDLATFAVLYFVFHANTPEQQALFQSGWFVEGLLSQTLIIHLIRTARVPFVQSTAALPLVLLTLVVALVGVAIPYTSIGAAVGLVPLPMAFFPWLAAILLGYCGLAQLVKHWYIRRFGSWL